MNRRDFVSRVALGTGAVCAGISPAAASRSNSGLKVRFVGMMAFIQRTDGSFLVATPGQQQSHHMDHTPFLMARAGSQIAKALDFEPVRGVLPEAFDISLAGSRPDDFVFKNLNNSSLEIVSGQSEAVTNHASEMGQMSHIAPGKRLRGNVERWASSTVSLRGGQIDNGHAHPDAGKVWRFGGYQQRLTDAVDFSGESLTTIRLTSAQEARSFRVPASGAQLWVFSAAAPDSSSSEPTMLEHSRVMFDYFVDAAPVIATCAEATGREVPATAIPYQSATSASNGIIASGAAMPPLTELCWVASILFGSK